VKNNFWFQCSIVLFALTASLYYYSNVSDKEDKNREIANLKHEVLKLQDINKSNKHIIEMLEKELEKAQDTSQHN
jgi:predicted RNase H-like nuclease (RuvC/YqgF family)